MVNDTGWYPRLGAITVLSLGPSTIDRTTLPGHDARPDITRYQLSEGSLVSLEWPTAGGSSSASPAAEHSAGVQESQSTDAVVRQIYEALELPGTPSDYHFVLLRGYEVLWRRRRTEPVVLPELERLCLLDMALLEARPHMFDHFGSSEGFAPSSHAATHLIDLYERDGAFDDALEIAKRAIRMGAVHFAEAVTRIEAKVSELRAEDA